MPTDVDNPARAAAGPEPRISVIVCTYDRYQLLDRAIESVLDQTLPAQDYEIIVVDNSPDQAAAAVHGERHAAHSRLRYRLEPVPGLSNARNVGLEMARGGIAAFLDDDARATRAWLEALLAAYAAFPEAGAVGGRVLPVWAEPRPVWLHDDLLDSLSVVDWGGPTRVLREGEWLAGTNISYRRQALIEAGGFSRALGRQGSDRVLLSNEENEAIARLKARGSCAVYAPKACVEHRIDPARLTQSWLRRRMAWQAVSDCISGVAAGMPPAVLAERLRELVDAGDGDAPGYFTPTADPERFRNDVLGVYYLVMALLAGGFDAAQEARAAGGRDSGLARILGWLAPKP